MSAIRSMIQIFNAEVMLLAEESEGWKTSYGMWIKSYLVIFTNNYFYKYFWDNNIFATTSSIIHTVIAWCICDVCALFPF